MNVTIQENIETILPELEVRDLHFLTTLGNGIVIKKSVGGFSIVADNIVGSISLPSGVTLEIRPKIGMVNLFRMLTHVFELYQPLTDICKFEFDSQLYDVIASAFSNELPKLVRKGLRKDYQTIEANRPAVRGRIAFNKYAKCFSTDPNLISCRYSELSFESAENKIVIAACQTLLKSHLVPESRKTELRDRIRHFPEIDVGKNPQTLFSKLSFGRHNDYYRRILSLAKLILNKDSVSSQTGDQSMRAFLVDLSKLFESYVAKFFRIAAKEHSLKAHFQSHRYLDLEKNVLCKPDIVVKTLGDGDTVFIADTKYKDVIKRGISSNDVYQCLAYMHMLNCDKSFLIYPRLSEQKESLPPTVTIIDEQGNLEITPVSVSIDNDSSCLTDCKDLIAKAHVVPKAA